MSPVHAEYSVDGSLVLTFVLLINNEQWTVGRLLQGALESLIAV